MSYIICEECGCLADAEDITLVDTNNETAYKWLKKLCPECVKKYQPIIASTGAKVGRYR